MIRFYQKLLAIIGITLLMTGCAEFLPSLHHQPQTPPPFSGNQAKTSSTNGAMIKTAGESGSQASAEQQTYLQADRLPPQYAPLKQKCVTMGGSQICGYDCKVSGNQAKCATDPKQRCIVGNDGVIKCGYDCKKTATEAACGKYLYNNCVTNSRGEVLCGNNCYERIDGELICGK